MKININYKLFTAMSTMCFSLSFAQKVEFTVPKSIDILENIIFDFKNDYTKEIAADAAAMEDNFSTTVDLFNLKYDGGDKNPYLNLALNKGAKSKQFIERASWMVSFKKISKKSTKVTIDIESIVPDRWSKKDVDVKLTKSTGKVENEIKEFLLTYKRPNFSSVQATADAAAEPTEEQMAAAEAQATAQMEELDNRRLIQQTTSKKLQALFGKKQLITLPTTADTFTKLLEIQPSEPECETCKGGKYSSWDIDEVFNLIYAKMNDGEEYYALQYYGDQKVAGLPYGLVFNESSASECKTKFARYKAQLYQTTVDVDANTSSALTVVTFKMDNRFVRLEFGNQYLTRLLVSNREQ
ncbi:hypothetical protein [Chryseobacterium jejuense]|uniref:Uncharacterized protein n=1 Tax=Chryseobacterium jejuense TaxID=445960 RepID=A0A2X2XSF1_CHRJE|nr:hypothetical protein [Chryseobacterium jejuense]SDJ29971.1 hypothetical protein SAMN05421542_3110 [Chryseobacterium jejuense]SQB28729.1 Uncharacterised protein [Chryseobacterium jejuense]